MWIDASALSAMDTGATQILGYQFIMDFDATEVGVFNFNLIAGSNIGFNAANPANSSITLNDATRAVAMASSTAIVDTDATNDGPPAFLGTEKLIGTFYVSPIDANATAVDITIKDMLLVTDTGNIEQSRSVAVTV